MCDGCHDRFSSEESLCSSHLVRGVCPRLCPVDHDHRLLVLEFESFGDAKQAMEARIKGGSGGGGRWTLVDSQCYEVVLHCGTRKLKQLLNKNSCFNDNSYSRWNTSVRPTRAG